MGREQTLWTKTDENNDRQQNHGLGDRVVLQERDTA